MIAFGCSITLPEIFKYAKRGIDLAAEPDSLLFPHAAAGSLARSYNLILDEASSLDDLEALVLVHQDAEIVDPELCAKLRATLEDPAVAVVGCVGATGARSIAWWEGSVRGAGAVCRYGELGGGDLPMVSWSGGGQSGEDSTGEVDTVYGVLLALSPWAVRNVRFDEGLSLLYGYDFDFCAQVREAGRKVVVAELGVAHHHSLTLVTEPESWMETHAAVAEKWDGRLPDAGRSEEDWKPRARRAEADAGAAQLLSASRQFQAHARAADQERHLNAIAGSVSFRLTEPLRRLNARRGR